MKTRTKTVLCDNFGWFAEVYTDDDHASGYGDNPRIGRWYGTRQECEALDPKTVPFRPRVASDEPDPFDLACERRYDG